MKISVSIGSRAVIDRTNLPIATEDAIKAAFTHKNPKHAEIKAMYGFRAAFKEPPFIKTYNLLKETLTVPRGGLNRLRDIFAQHKLRYQFIDERFRAQTIELPPHAVNLWAHQQRIVDSCIARENCIARSSTGSGKTTAGVAMIAQLKLPTIIVVWNSSLLDQWKTRLRKELGLKTIGQFGGGKKQLEDITVAMQQSLCKAKPVEWRAINTRFGVIICDEVQRFAARTFMDVIDNSTARYRIGLSASEKRKDGKECLIYDSFGGVAVNVDEKELIEAKLIHDVPFNMIRTGFDHPDYDLTHDFDDLLIHMIKDDDRNSLIVHQACVHAQAGHQVLVFTHRREHVKVLDRMISAAFKTGQLLGGKPDEEIFNRTLSGLKNGRVRVGVGTLQAIGVGLDIPTVSRGIIATPIHNNKQFLGQVKGRICRTSEGKDDASIDYLWDIDLLGSKPLVNIKRWIREVSIDGVSYAEYSGLKR